MGSLATDSASDTIAVDDDTGYQVEENSSDATSPPAPFAGIGAQFDDLDAGVGYPLEIADDDLYERPESFWDPSMWLGRIFTFVRNVGEVAGDVGPHVQNHQAEFYIHLDPFGPQQPPTENNAAVTGPLNHPTAELTAIAMLFWTIFVVAVFVTLVIYPRVRDIYTIGIPTAAWLPVAVFGVLLLATGWFLLWIRGWGAYGYVYVIIFCIAILAGWL